MTILGKKQMSEEDIKLNYITPVILNGWKGHMTMETKITDGRINISGNMVAYGKDMNIVRRELKVHISHLCYILCTAAEDYYKNNKEKFDFIKYSIEDDRPKTFL